MDGQIISPVPGPEARPEKHEERKCAMALVKCSECGQEISEQALACTKCGHPPAGRHKMLTLSCGTGWQLFQIIIGFFLGAAIFAGLVLWAWRAFICRL